MQLNDTLNRQIANWTVLHVKLHHYHWYVKGPHFFTLHEKFEELYNDAATYMDDLAERLLAIGGSPVATMKEVLAIASVAEAVGQESATQMVEQIVADFKRVVAELQDGMVVAESVSDESTGDMLLAMHAALEKHLWMLNAFLG